jgi:hypothetical protein
MNPISPRIPKPNPIIEASTVFCKRKYEAAIKSIIPKKIALFYQFYLH